MKARNLNKWKSLSMSGSECSLAIDGNVYDVKTTIINVIRAAACTAICHRLFDDLKSDTHHKTFDM